MRCYEKSNSPSLSSSYAVEEEEAGAPLSATPSGPTINHRISAHPASKLPSLRHVAVAPTAPPLGLTRYLQGLAAGDDLAELIRGLQSSISTCYHECTRKDTAATSLPAAAAAAATEASRMEPATPHPLPRSALSASQRRAYWSATKAAFLFAAESPSATEEATVLHCSPTTRSVLFPYYYPSGRADTAGPSTALPLTGVLRGGDMRMILSDARMVELAREAVRHDPREGWQQALRLLHTVSPTPLTCAVELELYRQTGGHHWAEALRCLWTMSPSHWTEMDAGSVLRCLYHAGKRRHVRQGLPTQQPTPSTFATATTTHGCEEGEGAEPSDVFLARLIAQALRVHRAVEETAALQWSVPSAFNDTLGLVAQDGSAWRDACLLLDKLLAAQQTDSGAPTPLPASCSPYVAVEGKGKEETAAAGHVAAPGVTSAQASSALYRLVRPNAVTMHQACRALQHHWATGLRYVQLLQEASRGSTELVSDLAATEGVLRLCIAGQRWQEALRLVEARLAVTRQPHTPAPLVEKTASAAAPTPRRHAVTAGLLGDRQHYRPDVFVQLVRLLGSVPAARPVAYALVQSHATTTPGTTLMPAPAVPNTRTHSESPAASRHGVLLSTSKHYNTDTLSRAYNCLLQGSATLKAADTVAQQLQEQHGAAGPLGSVSPTSTAVERYDALLEGLETESVAHIAYLCCVAGNWQRALHHTNALLHSPQYRATFLPTTRLHDAVQYALEQAPPPGPSWEVSMRLFTEMMDRNVPNSEVSFQSVVKRCFAGGAPEQAQRLFHLVLRKGVRS